VFALTVRTIGSRERYKNTIKGLRYLLVEAGWRILRTKGVEAAVLRAWGLASRRGGANAPRGRFDMGCVAGIVETR
jgi:hypothetical protein